MSQVWQVVAGRDTGGLAVRDGAEPQSRELEQKLSHAAFVEELELKNERLHYKLVTGTGPETGWVSTKVDDQELLRCIIKAPPKEPAPSGQPLFCAWYSGGFSKSDGEKLLAPFMQTLKSAGVQDTAIFHYPDAYGLPGQGREPWASYIDRLVEEIDRAAGSCARPLVLFGHSRGAAPATCVAFRQPQRVKKVYIAACSAMRAGEATGWELLSQRFQEGGDRELLKWFSSLQPDNILLHRTAYDTSDSEFEEQMKSSKFLADMLQVMRVQYRDAMFPDPARDFGVMPVPIMAIAPLLDESCQPQHCKDWGLLTSAGFQLETVQAGHMDCLQAGPAPIPSDIELQNAACPLLPQADEEMMRTLRNFARVQAVNDGKGQCELSSKICQDLQQFLK
ncbi:unnamed protein product [Effrenium voratum]|uniref:AB hydrolase-1 domain-containing protein n=1 Tax=Effrenium voratum TaxID=2562239 RepID=A0AA36IW00_9DINO|nr:unnamed protein product [Effrenium voratum]